MQMQSTFASNKPLVFQKKTKLNHENFVSFPFDPINCLSFRATQNDSSTKRWIEMKRYVGSEALM